MEGPKGVFEDIFKSKTSAPVNDSFRKSFLIEQPGHQPAGNKNSNLGYNLLDLPFLGNICNSHGEYKVAVTPRNSRPSVDLNSERWMQIEKKSIEDGDFNAASVYKLPNEWEISHSSSIQYMLEVPIEKTESADINRQRSIITLYKQANNNCIFPDIPSENIVSSNDIISPRTRRRIEERSENIIYPRMSGRMEQKPEKNITPPERDSLNCISLLFSYVSSIFCMSCCSCTNGSRKQITKHSAISEKLVSLSFQFIPSSRSLSAEKWIYGAELCEVLVDSDEESLFEDSVLCSVAMGSSNIGAMDRNTQTLTTSRPPKINFKYVPKLYMANISSGSSINSCDQTNVKRCAVWPVPASKLPRVHSNPSPEAIYLPSLEKSSDSNQVSVTQKSSPRSSYRLTSLSHAHPIRKMLSSTNDVEIARSKRFHNSEYNKQPQDNQISFTESLFEDKPEIPTFKNGTQNPQVIVQKSHSTSTYPRKLTINGIKKDSHQSDDQSSDSLDGQSMRRHSSDSPADTVKSTSRNSCESQVLKIDLPRSGPVGKNGLLRAPITSQLDAEYNKARKRYEKIVSDTSLRHLYQSSRIQKSTALDQDSGSFPKIRNSSSTYQISTTASDNLGGRKGRFSGFSTFGGMLESRSIQMRSSSDHHESMSYLSLKHADERKISGTYQTWTCPGKVHTKIYSRSVNSLLERSVSGSHNQRKKEFFRKKIIRKHKILETSTENVLPCEATCDGNKTNPNFVKKYHTLVLERKLYDPPISVDKFINTRTEPGDDNCTKTVKALAYLSCFSPMFTTAKATMPSELDLHPGVLARLLKTPENPEQDPFRKYSQWDICSKGFLHFYRSRYSESHCNYHLYQVWKEMLEMGQDLSVKLRNLLALGNHSNYNIYDQEISTHGNFFRLALNIFAKNILIGAKIGRQAVTLADKGVVDASKEYMLKETNTFKSFKNVINTHMDADPTFDLEGHQLYDEAKLLAPCIFKYFGGYVSKFRGMKILYKWCRIHSRAHYYLLSDRVYDCEGSQQSKVSYLSAPMLILNWLSAIFYFENPVFINLFIKELEADPIVDIVSIKNEINSNSLVRITLIVKNLERIGKPSNAEMSSFFLEIRLQFYWKWFFRVQTFRLEHISRCEPEHLLKSRNIRTRTNLIRL